MGTIKQLRPAAAALCAALLLSPPGRAGPEAGDEQARAATQQAKGLYYQGRREFNLGHYAEALALFESAYKAQPAYRLLYNIGQCHRLLGQLESARRVYSAFLAESPKGESMIAAAEEKLAEVEAALRAEAAQRAGPPAGTSPASRTAPAPGAAHPPASAGLAGSGPSRPGGSTAPAPAPPSAAPPAGLPADAKSLPEQLLAILEFRNKLEPELRRSIDAGYLADRLREAVLRLPSPPRMITRENVTDLLQAQNRSLVDCQGECETETARRLGADLVISGELLVFGEGLRLSLKLHETLRSSLLSATQISGGSAEDLERGVPEAAVRLLAPVMVPHRAPLRAAPGPTARPAAPPPQPVAATPVRPPTVPAPQAPKEAGTEPRAESGGSTTVAAAGGRFAEPPSAGRSGAEGVAQAGDRRKDHALGLSWVFLPAGSFSLGCVPDDRLCATDERPTRRASVGNFWLNRTEVDVNAFKKCVRAGACAEPEAEKDPCNWERRPDHPMNCVDWNQASAYCKWARGSLPTAAEWEYAARSGEAAPWPWGPTPPTQAHARFDSLDGTAPVGTYSKGDTRWGVSDLAGNVAEWTASDYSSQEKEIRGGNWTSTAKDLRVSARSSQRPGYRSDLIGFRCAVHENTIPQ